MSRRNTRTQKEWKVEIQGLRKLRAPTICSTRPAISPAALLVKVTAKTDSGRTPRSSIRWATR